MRNFILYLVCWPVFSVSILWPVFTTMLTADQKPALASLIQTGGQVLAFVCIYILTKNTTGSLSALALAFSGIPCLLLLVVSILMFYGKRYKIVAPSLHYIRFSLTKKILGDCSYPVLVGFYGCICEKRL